MVTSLSSHILFHCISFRKYLRVGTFSPTRIVFSMSMVMMMMTIIIIVIIIVIITVTIIYASPWDQ